MNLFPRLIINKCNLRILGTVNIDMLYFPFRVHLHIMGCLYYIIYTYLFNRLQQLGQAVFKTSVEPSACPTKVSSKLACMFGKNLQKMTVLNKQTTLCGPARFPLVQEKLLNRWTKCLAKQKPYFEDCSSHRNSKSAQANKATVAVIVIQAITVVLDPILSLSETLCAKTLTEAASILCQFRDLLEVLPLLFHDNLQTL